MQQRVNISCFGQSRISRVALCVATIVFGSVLFVLPVHSTYAQAPPNAGNKISLDFQNAPITKVLQTLFRSAGNINNSIDPDVQGTVTVNLADVSFQTALNTLLNSTLPPLTYRIDSGVYHISVKRDVGPSNTGTAIAPPTVTTEEKRGLYKIKLYSYDGLQLYPLILSLLNKTQGNPYLGANPPISTTGGQTGGQGSGQGGFGGGQGGFGGGQGGFGGGGGGFGGGQGGFGGGGGGFGGGGGGFGGGGGGRGGF